MHACAWVCIYTCLRAHAFHNTHVHVHVHALDGPDVMSTHPSISPKPKPPSGLSFQAIKVSAAGQFESDFELFLPPGSVLVQAGNGADLARYAVSSVNAPRVEIVLRKNSKAHGKTQE